MIFAGDSLRLNSGGQLSFRGNNTTIITIHNFTLNGTAVIENALNSTQQTLSGNLTLSPTLTGGFKHASSSGGLTVASKIDGSGSLLITNTSNATYAGVTLTNSNNTYSGGTSVSANGSLNVAADGALGSGNVTVTNAKLTLGGGSAHNYIGNSATLTFSAGLAASAINLNFSGTDALAGMSLNGGANYLSIGVYSATDLNSLYGSSAFTGLGNLQIGNGGTFDVNSGDTLVFSSSIGGSGGLTKNGAGTLILNATSTYTGVTVVNDGTLSLSNEGALGSTSGLSLGNATELNYTGNATNFTRAITVATGTATVSNNGSGRLTLSGAISQNGTSLVLDGDIQGIDVTGSITGAAANSNLLVNGNVSLSAANSYVGTTTINTGTLTIGNTSSLGSGALTQANDSSLLKIETTGTIANNLSVSNVLASQTATLGGSITVNNSSWEVESGETLILSGGVSGTGGVTKNGNGTLILSGSNSYASSTTVNAGTLTAADANALGGNTTVQVNGGSLLVTADDAINGKNITLASTANGNGTSASLAFSGSYNGTVGALTLSQDSIIDLGTGSVAIHFTELVMGVYNLAIYNWTGTTLWGGGSGNNTDQFYVDRAVSDSELNRISFYSGFSSSSFVGTGFQLSGGSFNQQIIPVPEPEIWVTGILLVLSNGVWLWRRRKHASICGLVNRSDFCDGGGFLWSLQGWRKSSPSQRILIENKALYCQKNIHREAGHCGSWPHGNSPRADDSQRASSRLPTRGHLRPEEGNGLGIPRHPLFFRAVSHAAVWKDRCRSHLHPALCSHSCGDRRAQGRPACAGRKTYLGG